MTEDTKDFLFSACVRFALDFKCIFVVVLIIMIIIAINFKAAIRILCTEEAPAPVDHITLQALRNKHPGPATNRHTPVDPSGSNLRFSPLQVSPEDVKRALRTFPLRSSGGPDGLTHQHIIDLHPGDSDGILLNSLSELINLMLAGKFDTNINTIIFGGRLLAMARKTVVSDQLQWVTL